MTRLQKHPEVFSLADRLWIVLRQALNLLEGRSDQVLPGSPGWNVATPIRSRRANRRRVVQRYGITHAPLDETQQDIVAVYCSLLGGLLELKRTEADLAHERDLLQSLMDNIPDLIYFKDTTSRFMRVNKPQASLLGAATPRMSLVKPTWIFRIRNWRRPSWQKSKN